MIAENAAWIFLVLAASRFGQDRLRTSDLRRLYFSFVFEYYELACLANNVRDYMLLEWEL